MVRQASPRVPTQAAITSRLPKAPTGIQGLDEITGGGLPRGRPTLVCGGPGCGKTLLAVEFLVRGALQHGEPGVFMSFEERAGELGKNVQSLGFDLHELERRRLLKVDHVRVERGEIEETGEYDLEGLFVRLGHAIDSIGARRVVLDTIESLFAALSNASILRAELRRLFGWLKDRGVTAIVTGERGTSTLTRQGLEEYVSDCVILLDHRVKGHISTRRLRVVKYRGSSHGTNEYPFLIEDQGITLAPITSLGLDHEVSGERVSSGVAGLDAMLDGRGFYRGSSILMSGTAGTGKTSVALTFAQSICRKGGRFLYFAYEESASQVVRNARSIGLDLEPHVRAKRLLIHADRPEHYGLEMHLALMHHQVCSFRPVALAVDPLNSLLAAGEQKDVHLLVLRLVDFLKHRNVTALFTSLTHGGEAIEGSDTRASSLMDTWLLVRDIELGGERNRALYVLKSRGMAHSNQIREFLITSKGIQLRDAYLSKEGVLTGSARLAQEERDRRAETESAARAGRRRVEAGRRRQALVARIQALRHELEGIDEDTDAVARPVKRRTDGLMGLGAVMPRSRRADGNGSSRRHTHSTGKGGAR
ncbi:MAG: circadian clock protein KaiC [Candidatus Polarisedimenticolia bacterium]